MMLEMSSVKRWIALGLLLIVSVSVTICKPKQSRKFAIPHTLGLAGKIDELPRKETLDKIIILDTRGFIGEIYKEENANKVFMRSAQSSGGGCSDRAVTEQQIQAKNKTGCQNLFLSMKFVHDVLRSNNTGVSFGVSLSYDSQLTVNRNDTPTVVCLVEGRCSGCSWVNWTITASAPPQMGNCSVTCLSPEQTCETAQYQNCTKNINIIKIQQKNATCYKCGSPILAKPKEITISTETSEAFNKSQIDPKVAAAVMKNLSSLLDLMGNLSVASVSMGKAEGILKKINNKNEISSGSFIHSPESGLTVIEDLDKMSMYPSALSIPAEAFMKAFNQSAGKAFLGVFRFPSMTKNENTFLNDEVYAIEMGTEISNLTDSVNLIFTNKQEKGTAECRAWNGDASSNWTTDGCNTSVEDEKITCKCEHLTFFAVLMAAPNIQLSQADLTALSYITYIGCGISMFFLGVGLFMHYLLRKAKASNSVHVLLNLFLAMFLLNLAFLSNEYVARAQNPTACRIMAGFMHYCLLATFTWFGVEAFHLCLQMTKYSIAIKHYLIKISVVGWVPPALVVSVIFFLRKYGEQTIHTDSSSNATMCWIVDSTVHYAVNIGYYSFIFVFTFSTFIVVLRWLCIFRIRRTTVKRSKTATSDITTIMSLCCLLGLTWSFSFFSYGALRVPSFYIFTILNSFQGLFLFIYYHKTSAIIGEEDPSGKSDTVEENMKTENPYDNCQPTAAGKKPL